MGMTIDLFPYQSEAFDMFMDRGSLLLALDTGMGKTATAIAICEDLLERRKVRSCLLVVPANLKYQWAKAIAKVTDIPSAEIKVKRKSITVPLPEYCAIVDGDPEKRARIYTQAYADHPEYIIVGFDNVETDFSEFILGLNPGMTVVDEASMIKTMTAARTLAVKGYLKTPYRLALTATPVENIPEDVYSIMQWVDPKILGRWDLFDKSYISRGTDNVVHGYKNLDVLFDRLSAGMYRKSRLDPDVKDFMPDVARHVWEVRTSPEILRAYVDMCRDLIAAADGSPGRARGFKLSDGVSLRAGRKENRGHVMSIHTAMEMLLDYPPMIVASAVKYAETEDQGSKYAAELISKGFVPPEDRPKLDRVVSEVDTILGEDESSKVIIFCRYREMLNILKRDFEHLGHGVTEYHGTMSLSGKEASVSKFLEDEDCRIFLSSHAGAYGTDLPVANWLVNLDIVWGFGIKTQLNGRHVRASSEFPFVNVVDVITTGTIEARKATIQDFKGDVSGAIVDGIGKASIARDIESLISHARAVVADWDQDE
jgi:SNF2 family DNA or RNA helicase